MRGNPKVSVILPVFNGEKYIVEAISSILNQSYTNFELIVVNDGSTDHSRHVVASFEDQRIILVENVRNRGLVFSLNRGMELACGEFVARMDADDIAHRERLRLQVEYLDTHPSVGLVGTAIRQIDEQGRFLEDLVPPSRHETIKWKFLFETAIFHATIVMRKSLVDTNGGYNPAFPHVEDTELWSRLLDVTEFANLPDVLYTRRWHSESVCNSKWAVQFATVSKIRHSSFEKILRHPIDLSTVTSLSKCLNFSDARISRAEFERVVALMAEAYHAYLSDENCSDADRAAIAADLAHRIASLADKDETFSWKWLFLKTVRAMVPFAVRRALGVKFAFVRSRS